MNKLECKKCGYKWLPRIETKPKLCPSCKNRKWNEEKQVSMSISGLSRDRHK